MFKSMLFKIQAIRVAMVLSLSALFTGCVFDRSVTFEKFEEHKVFYSCVPGTFVLNENLTMETTLGDNGVKQIIQFTADCVLRRDDTLEALDGNANSDVYDDLPFGEPDTFETVVFRGEYNFNPDEPDWVQGFTSETVRRPNGDLLYDGNWFCNNNPWLNWDGPDYICGETYNVFNRFASAYTNKDSLNQFTHWVKEDSLPHVKRVPRSARYMSDSDRSLLEGLFAPFEGMGDESSASAYIYTPSQFEIFSENFISIDIGVQGMYSNQPQPSIVEAAWRRIVPAPSVVGDIALPSSATLWEEPTVGPKYLLLTNSIASIQHNSNYFEGNQPGLYEIKVKDIQQGGWSAPKYFWIGQPSFDTKDLFEPFVILSESYMNDLRDNGVGSHIARDPSGNDLELVIDPQSIDDEQINVTLMPGIGIDYVPEDNIAEVSNSYNGLTFYIDDVEEESESASITLNCLPVEHCMEFVRLMPEQKTIAVSLSGMLLNSTERSMTEFISELESDDE